MSGACQWCHYIRKHGHYEILVPIHTDTYSRMSMHITRYLPTFSICCTLPLLMITKIMCWMFCNICMKTCYDWERCSISVCWWWSYLQHTQLLTETILATARLPMKSFPKCLKLLRQKCKLQWMQQKQHFQTGQLRPSWLASRSCSSSNSSSKTTWYSHEAVVNSRFTKCHWHLNCNKWQI